MKLTGFGIRAPLRIFTIGLLALTTLGAAAAPAFASQMVAFGVHKPGMIVNRHGIARVSYTTAAGVRRHVLAWGAINALTMAR